MSLPRAYPTDRLCCALALLQSQSHKARDTTLRVIAAHHGEKYAAMVRARFDALSAGGEQ